MRKFNIMSLTMSLLSMLFVFSVGFSSWNIVENAKKEYPGGAFQTNDVINAGDFVSAEGFLLMPYYTTGFVDNTVSPPTITHTSSISGELIIDGVDCRSVFSSEDLAVTLTVMHDSLGVFHNESGCSITPIIKLNGTVLDTNVTTVEQNGNLKALNTEFTIENFASLGDKITVSVELGFTVCDAIFFLKNVYPLFNDESFKLGLQTTVQEAEVTS